MSHDNQGLNIVLVAEEGAGLRMLKVLSGSNDRLVAVLTSPPTKAALGATPWELARKAGYNTLPAHQAKDPGFADVLRKLKVDILLNVHSLFVIAPEVLAVPRIGSFNLHPGPLPRYAGLNAPSWAIYRGERHYGATVHHMVPAIDAGPIAYQALFAIDEDDTGLSLYAKCIQEGLVLMRQLLQTAAADPGAIPRIPQDLSQREYFGRKVPENGGLCWSRPAREVVNFVRAAYYYPFPSPWGHPRTFLGSREFGVVRASLADQPADLPPGTVAEALGPSIRVACGDTTVWIHQVWVDGNYLEPSELLRPGERLLNGS